MPAVIASWVIEMILENFTWRLKIKKKKFKNQSETILPQNWCVFSFKQELIFAIPQARALMEEHASMHWTRLFATVRYDSRENIAEVREYYFNLF